MSFASINSTIPRINPCNFHKNILKVGDFEKLSFFESAILFLFFKKNNAFFLLHPHENQSVSWAARMGRNFDDYPGFQQIPYYLRYTVYLIPEKHLCYPYF